MAASSTIIGVDLGALRALAGQITTARLALVDDVGIFSDGGNGIEHHGLRSAVDDFDARWSDKRHQIADGLEKTGSTLRSILDTFECVDDALAEAVLEGGASHG